ncbi:hypothetical protein BDQ12DRAFT_689859 [Crucibulum laeve]|uniref:Uncharacterized protein n=1 Tax=Crucibulum laeve TaxID=68775 RepID=A0A5C3LN64_9AGAR|nr:hypothetical protein BDQ12DRAFT_689859 [Crucibulum laeve]
MDGFWVLKESTTRCDTRLFATALFLQRIQIHYHRLLETKHVGWGWLVGLTLVELASLIDNPATVPRFMISGGEDRRGVIMIAVPRSSFLGASYLLASFPSLAFSFFFFFFFPLRRRSSLLTLPSLSSTN